MFDIIWHLIIILFYINLQLSTALRLNLSYIRPAKLARNKSIRNRLEISGWSKDVTYLSNSVLTQPLQKMYIERPRNCDDIFRLTLDENQVCAYGSPRSSRLNLVSKMLHIFLTI